MVAAGIGNFIKFIKQLSLLSGNEFSLQAFPGIASCVLTPHLVVFSFGLYAVRVDDEKAPRHEEPPSKHNVKLREAAIHGRTGAKFRSSAVRFVLALLIVERLIEHLYRTRGSRK